MSFLDARITQNLHLKIKIQTKRADGPVRRSKYEKSCAMSSLFCFLCQLKSITKPVHAYLPLDFSKLGEKRLVFFSVAWVLSISRLESFLGNPCLSICGPLKRTSLAADVFSVAWVLSIYQLSFFSLDFKVFMEYSWNTPYLSTFVLIENTEKVVDVFSVARVLSISSRLFLCWKSVYCASPKCSRRGYMCAVKQEDIIWECLVLSTLPPQAENDGRHGACLLLWVLPDTTCIRRMSSFIQFSLLFCQLEKVKKTT